ncbi:MAG TPA: hypothetical protein PKC41_07050 [Chitinophagaceae bacterium]|jgi:hypothetical protein|nr:hypothetical protein [Chitinophagaceae bacterium]
MLLNFSNHPSAQWPENQISSAQILYGNVVDLSFPNIDPESDEAQIAFLCKQYFEKIVEANPNAVHIMGELSFCFRLISLLKNHGITCIASTTYRNTLEINGMKYAQFQFVRFRKY